MHVFRMKNLFLFRLIIWLAYFAFCHAKDEKDLEKTDYNLSDAINSTLQTDSNYASRFNKSILKNDVDSATEKIMDSADVFIHVAAWKFGYVQVPLIITIFLLSMCILKMIIERFHKLSETVPESCMLLILGTFIGCLLVARGADVGLAFLKFNSYTFFMYMYPLVVLDAVYSLKDLAFIDNIGTILLYAILGTIFNVVIIGSALYGFYLLGIMGSSLTITFFECLMFSTFLSATDPVAALAIFQSMGVNKMLYFLVFGESLLNDGISIVLYNTVQQFLILDVAVGTNQFGATEFGLGCAAFICVCVIAALIGTTFGFATAFLTKYSSKIESLQPLLVFGFAYLSYLVALMFDFSGVISLICCGLIQAHYAMENISLKSFISVQHISKLMSNITESLMFIMLSAMAVNINEAWKDFNVVFSVLAVVLCVITRFLVTYGLTYCVNRCLHGFRNISFREQFIIAYGGLRGPVTFALALSLDPNLLKEKEKTQHVFITAAYVVIFFTTFFQGMTMKPLVKLLNIRLESNDTDLVGKTNLALIENSAAAMERIVGSRGSHYWTTKIKDTSRRYLRPLVNTIAHKQYSSIFIANEASKEESKHNIRNGTMISADPDITSPNRNSICQKCISKTPMSNKINMARLDYEA